MKFTCKAQESPNKEDASEDASEDGTSDGDPCISQER